MSQDNVVSLASVANSPKRRRRPRERSSFGTVEVMNSGRFQARFVCPLDGRRYTAEMTFDTRQAADAFLVKERRLIESDPDGWLPPKERRARRTAEAEAKIAGEESFNSFADRWLPMHAARRDKDLKPRTVANYERLLQLLVGEFGDTPLRAFNGRQVSAWYAGFQRNHQTQRRQAYQVLKMLMDAAVREGIIPVNPCQVELVGSSKAATKVTIVTEEDLAAIVREMPERHRLMVQLAAWCALRFGELTELRRKDVERVATAEADRYELVVERGVVRVTQGRRTRVIVGTPKSDAGIRRVSVPPHLNAEVADHLERFVGDDPEALLFPGGSGNNHLSNSSFVGKAPTPAKGGKAAKPGHGWYRARALAGRDDLKFHHLRHTGAVKAAHAGATLADLMGRLGHSTPAAAMLYQHAAKGRDAVIAEEMSRGRLATE